MLRKIKIGVFDSEYQTNNRYIITAIIAAFKRHQSVAAAQIIEFHTSHELMRQASLDVLVVVGSAESVHWQMPRWRSMGTTTVFWATEDPYEVANNLRYNDKFDVIFTNDLAALPLYPAGTHHLPLAGSIDHHLLDVRDNAELDYDILFVGTAWPNRVDDLNYVLENTDSSIRFKIGLPGNPYIPKPHINDPRIIYDWRCTPRGFAGLANRSKITLTLGRNFSGSSGKVYGSTPPPRIFELGLAGTVQVFVAGSREIDRYYDTSRELISVPTIEEAMPAVRSLLEDSERRRSFAIAMQNRTLKDHTYDQRVETVLAEVAKARKRKQVATNSDAEVNTSVGHKNDFAKRKILLVAHNIEGKRPGGGVEVYLTSVVPILRRSFDVFILTPEQLGDRTVLDLILPDGTNILHDTHSPFSNEYISQPALEGVLFNIIVRHNIELVHFHHLLGMPLSYPIVAKLAGARTAFTFHDYYLICDNFNLISYENKFCEFHRRSPTFCDVCLRSTKGFAYGSQAARRNVISRVLKAVDLSIFNTEYSLCLAREVYDFPEGASAIIEMLMPDEPYYGMPEQAAPVAGGAEMQPLSVKIPGNFFVQKGAHKLIPVMELLADDEITFHILGSEDPALAKVLDAVGNPKIRRQRGYRQNEVSSLLSDGDVSINFAIWPETYMISLSESWAAGNVPIVSDLGAPAERVTDGVDGFIVPSGDVGSIVDTLRMLAHDRDRLAVMKARIRQKRIVRSRDHANILAEHYERLMSPIPRRQNALRGKERLIFHRIMYGERHTNNKWTDLSTLWDHDYGNRHLIQNWESIPRFPHADVPIKYWHLPRTEYDNRIVRKVEIIEHHTVPSNLGQERSVWYRIHPVSDLELVEVFFSIPVNAADMVLPLTLMQTEPLGARVYKGELPPNIVSSEVDIICVYDGQIFKYTNRSVEAPASQLEKPDATPEKTEVLQGCDRVERIFVENNHLHVQGWAFDPLTGTVPSECDIVLSASDGAELVARVEHVFDPSIAEAEPMFGYSAVTWSCPLAEVIQKFRNSLGNLSLRMVQRTDRGRITSGNNVALQLYRKGRGDQPIVMVVKHKIEPSVLRKLKAALKSSQPGIDAKEAEGQAKLLVELIDTRILFAQALRRHPNEKERRGLLSFYVAKGEIDGHAPRPDFDPTTYRENNPEIVGISLPLLIHWWNFGRKEGRIASKKQRPVLDKNVEVVRLYLDEEYYRPQAFGDATFSGDLAQHYIAVGEKNDLCPNENFDPAKYRRVVTDIDPDTICLFAHFITSRQEALSRAAEETERDQRRESAN